MRAYSFAKSGYLKNSLFAVEKSHLLIHTVKIPLCAHWYEEASWRHLGGSMWLVEIQDENFNNNLQKM